MILLPAKEMGLLQSIGLAVALTFLVTGCGRVAPLGDAELDRSLDYQRARKAADAGDFRAAAAAYNRLLRQAPDAARAHLELGLLYDEKLGEPLMAIYHYRQYLELQPDSPKRQLVEDFAERAKVAYAAQLPQPVALDTGELIRLQNENATLRAQLAELQSGRRSPSGDPVESRPSETVSHVPRTHIVQKGDTLQSLALRYYGSRAGWEKIFAANRASLPSKDQLRIGQQLVIPD